MVFHFSVVALFVCVPPPHQPPPPPLLFSLSIIPFLFFLPHFIFFHPILPFLFFFSFGFWFWCVCFPSFLSLGYSSLFLPSQYFKTGRCSLSFALPCFFFFFERGYTWSGSTPCAPPPPSQPPFFFSMLSISIIPSLFF